MQWIVAGILGVLLSVTAGHVSGSKSGREEVANECRQAGKFTVKRTGFSCEVIRK